MILIMVLLKKSNMCTFYHMLEFVSSERSNTKTEIKKNRREIKREVRRE